MSSTSTALPAQIQANQHIYNDFDPAFAESMVRHVFNKLNDIYFRIQYVGFDHPIQRNNPGAPVILASNHSGMALPWDAIAFMAGLLRRFDYDHTKVCRVLIAPVLSKVGVMVPYFIPNFWRKCGGIDATYFNFETMMHHPFANVLIYPEGIAGIGKGFTKRYQLQRLSTSFVRMSLKYDTDIVPFSTVNGEYVNPFMYNVPPINWVVRRLTGLPFLPMGLLTLLLLFQPWFFYYSFPAKLTYVKGKRIRRKDLSEKSFSEITEAEIINIRDEIQLQMQEELDEAVRNFGKQPFKLLEFFKTVWQKRRYFPFIFPFGWPLLFSEFHRQWEKAGEIELEFSWKMVLRLFWKKPIVLAYFIPVVGWLPIIWLAKKHKQKLNGKTTK